MSKNGSTQTPERATEQNADAEQNSAAANSPVAEQKTNHGPAQSPGKLLTAGRISRELTVEEVGDALNLSPQTVGWLEDDNFEALPAPAFTQGYIRNYAKYVELDADMVVSAYQLKAGKPDMTWESPGRSVGLAELVQRHPGMLITVVVAAVVLLIVVVLAIVWPADEENSGAEPGPEIGMEVAPNAPNSENGSRTTGTEQTAQETSSVPAEAQSRSAQAERLSAAPNSADNSSPNLLNEGAGRSGRFDDPNSRIDRDAIDPNDPLAHLPVAKTYPVGPSSESASGSNSLAESDASSLRSYDSSGQEQSSQPAADENYVRVIDRRLTAEGSSVLRIEVVQDCWISIKNIAGRELFARLGREGQSIRLTGEGPFRVLLGYAPGASLYLDDREILLAPYTRNSVASLVVGQ